MVLQRMIDFYCIVVKEAHHPIRHHPIRNHPIRHHPIRHHPIRHHALDTRRVCMARSTAPKAPRPQSGLGTRPFNFFISTGFFIGECGFSTGGVI